MEKAFFAYRRSFANAGAEERRNQLMRDIGFDPNKDWKQPDDGTEQKVDQCLTTQWTTYIHPLKVFSDVNLSHLYVMFEVIFAGSSSFTFQVRNVRYSPD